MKKTLLALAVGGMLAATQAHAGYINVGGVVWDPAVGDDFFATDTIFETVVSGPGDTLSGYGKINAINFENSFCPGCELTYQFGGFTLNSSFKDNNLNSVMDAGDNVFFTGGWVKMYVDFTPDYAPDNFGSAGDEGGANALWLDLTAKTLTNSLGQNGTLFSLLKAGILGTGTEGGEGNVNLDVIGGSAAGNFDTNQEAGGSDLYMTSSFQPRNCISNGTCTSQYVIGGTNEITGNSIPEPGTLGLLGLGLLGFGALRRRYSAQA